ncbi:MAG TPA: L,D-transpeptidase [Xanthobacteraceae bacterium]|nr:L,D-transpeptidase [Xanthobacteraceae bacterium]
MSFAFTIALLGTSLWVTAAQAQAPKLTPESINAAQWSEKVKSGRLSPVVLKAQVLLARAKFSPGVIDARGGENFSKALSAFQSENGLQPTGALNQESWTKLAETSSDPIVIEYTVRADDLAGPFVEKIPQQFEQMAELEWLGYRTPRELLAEKFQMDEELLKALNKGQRFDKKGANIIVANVRGERPNGKTNGKTNGSAKAARLEVRKAEKSVRVFAEDGKLIAFYPATIGSEEKPAPSGTFEVRAVATEPTYRYNPQFQFKGQKATEPVEIASGPNNPVGLVWIALTAETYGIHGTPEPDKISKSFSHGCVRLTNWDALALAHMVKKGTPVAFVE